MTGGSVRGIARYRGTGIALLGLALGCLAVAVAMNGSIYGAVLAAAGASILWALLMIGLAQWIRARSRRRMLTHITDFVEHDIAASFVADELGRLLYLNPAARRQYDVPKADTIEALLQDVFAHPAAILSQLQQKAKVAKTASDDIVTRKGHIRLNVHRMEAGGYLWRIEDIGIGPARAHSGSGLPMLTVGRGNTILFMNDAARNFVGERARALSSVFPNMPLRDGGFNMALSADGPRNCLIHEVEHHGAQREVYFLPMIHEEQVIDAGKAAFDGLPVAVLRLGSDGTILRSNRLARDLLCMDDDDDLKLPQLVTGLGRPIVDWLAAAAAGDGLNNTEFLRVKRADHDVFVQISLNRILDPKGNALIAVLHDATELKSLEAQFVQSQKMQAIGELAGGIAHDFNNLLTAISGHCDLLLLRHENSDPDYADLVQISQNSNRAAALVGQLLAFSRKQTLRPVEIDIRNALADLTHLLNRLVGEKINLVLRHDPAPWTIRADRRQLEQVLMNLVVNARDAMPRGGEIRIEACNKALEEPMERDRAVIPAGEYLTIEVSDDGCGIAADKRKKVFEPFFTTKRPGEGTGLGLSTVYGIVKQSGGYVFIDSEVGRGTTFTLMFPVYFRDETEPETKPETIPAEPPALIHGDAVVLLVEDEAPVRAFASRALRLRGYCVIEAGNGEEALEMLADPNLRVDLFVTDVIMPGKDGPTWVREALKTRPEVRVVFISGYAEDALDSDQGEIPNSTYLPKPFSLTDLTETVQRRLH
ncbi:hybrid sensor histidine kinase/response regulator [Thalassovita gelatinovora]|nr:response regulator [Thalassovita gelatinovora]